MHTGYGYLMSLIVTVIKEYQPHKLDRYNTGNEYAGIQTSHLLHMVNIRLMYITTQSLCNVLEYKPPPNERHEQWNLNTNLCVKQV